MHGILKEITSFALIISTIKTSGTNTMAKKISIIIPCYNHGKFLKDTVMSALSSTYKNIEIVIVNDGSSDNSEAVALNLAKEHDNIKYLSQKNSGLPTARNNGIKNSTGYYILPLDSDDLISEDYISEAVKVLGKNPEVKVVYCNADFFGEKTGKWELADFKLSNLVLDNQIFCSAVYRKDDWEKINGYDERLTWGWEDWEFWISLLKSGGKVEKLQLTGFFYRINSKSMRKKLGKSGKKKVIKLLNIKHKDFIYNELGGPLRSQRGLSKKINRLYRLFGQEFS